MANIQQIDAILECLGQIKDVIAGGIRCAQLLQTTVEKLMPKERKIINDFSTEFQKMLVICNAVEEYRTAVVGTMATPVGPAELEVLPVSPIAGLVHGNRAPMERLLQKYSPIKTFFYQQLVEKEETMEVFSSVSMFWLQQHPHDYEASSREMVAFDNTSSAKRKDFEGKAKHLLLLNLQLHFPADQWVETLRVRDCVVHTLEQALASIPPDSAELQEVLRITESAISSLSLIRIQATPKELKQSVIDSISKCLEVIIPYLHQSEHDVKKMDLVDRISSSGRQFKFAVGQVKNLSEELTTYMSQLQDVITSPCNAPLKQPEQKHE